MRNVFAVIGLIALCMSGTSAHAERRLAFVVGIDTYSNLPANRQLRTAVNDAKAVARTLQDIGFSVSILDKSPTLRNISEEFATFKQKIKPGDMVLVYYAGHGFGISNQNYLLPSDIPEMTPDKESAIRRLALAESDLIADIQEQGAQVTIMVIDACRDNPFPETGTRSAGSGSVVAPRPPPEGVFSLYSASYGQRALDRLSNQDSNPNSVFTRVFVAEMKKPGVNLVDLGEAVRDEVSQLAETRHRRQVPGVYNQLTGARRIFLSGLPLAPGPAGPGAGGRTADPPPDEPHPVFSPRAALAPIVPLPTVTPIRRSALPPRFLPSQDYSASPGVFLPTSQDYGRRRYEKAAAAGDADAMLNLGYLYGNGWGVALDYGAARGWYEKAAAAGSATAMNNLGNLYRDGRGVALDYGAARGWYEKAAAAGEASAMNNLGVLYAYGRGVALDYGTARGWYKKAAAAGNATAMNNLGLLYEEGQGVAQNYGVARSWYEKAAAAGVAVAMTNLGFLYANGQGVALDYGAARGWFEKAVAAGDKGAQAYLGWLRN